MNFPGSYRTTGISRQDGLGCGTPSRPTTAVGGRRQLYLGPKCDNLMRDNFDAFTSPSDLKLLHADADETLSQLTTEIKRMLTVLVQRLTAQS
jgi:hypothetical protein